MRETDHTPGEHIVRMRIDRFKLRLPTIVEAILVEIPDRALRALVADIAMRPNEVVPKRLERPQPLVAYTINLLARALGVRDQPLDEIMKMTVAFVEAGDLYDDAVDGDYAEGHLHQLLAVSSTLHFVATRCALRLGPAVADGWLEAMYELPASLLLEKDGDGSLSTYLSVVQSQAALFSALGRVTAAVAGADEETARKVVELTKLLYAYLQYPHDLREAPVELAGDAREGSALAANIMRHMSVEQLKLLFGQIHSQMASAIEVLPDNRDAAHLRELITSMRPA